MTNSPDRTFGQELNTWVQTIGILIAAGWAVYTFIYKEIMIPSTAPVNITLNLQLKKLGTSDPNIKGQYELIPVEMTASATNPSSREVTLLPSVWIAYGYKIFTLPETDSKTFIQQANDVLTSDNAFFSTAKHYYRGAPTLVAMGRLFSDTFLRPGEKTTRTLIFYVLPGQYDSIEVKAIIPAAKKGEMIEAKWKLRDDLSLQLMMYRLTKSGDRKAILPDKDGNILEPTLEYQRATSISAISLSH